MKKLFCILILLFTIFGNVFSESSVILTGEDWITWTEEKKISFMQGYIMSNHFVIGMLVTHEVLPFESPPVQYLALIFPETTPESLVKDVDRYFLDEETLTHFIWMAIDLTQQEKKTPAKPEVTEQTEIKF